MLESWSYGVHGGHFTGAGGAVPLLAGWVQSIVTHPHSCTVSVLGLVPHLHNDRDQANTLQRQGEGRDLPADPGACGEEV